MGFEEDQMKCIKSYVISVVESLRSTGRVLSEGLSASFKGEPTYGCCSVVFIATAMGVNGRGDVARPPIAWLAAEKYANFAWISSIYSKRKSILLSLYSLWLKSKLTEKNTYMFQVQSPPYHLIMIYTSKRHHKHQAHYTIFHITYTMSLSQSPQIFWLGALWGAFGSGADTCRRGALAIGGSITPS